MNLHLKDKIVIVTGSTGICKEVALRFAEEESNVAITYLNEIDKKSAYDSIERIKNLGRKAISIQMDVRNFKDIKNMVKKVLDEFGKIDILVNCAGICTSVLAERLSEDQWDLDMDVDLKGLFFCCQEVFKKSMKKKNNGSIVNVSSVVGINPIKMNPIYGAAKAGVINITRYLSIEWGPFNVRVNCVSPGWIATKILLEQQKKGKSADPNSVKRSVPLARFGMVGEIADAIVFLASERSSFTTGANLVIDGGLISGIKLYSLVKNRIEML